MRQLPMQVTDIVTGLASGQSVFMVAIQQGGQLRDSFGGVAPALRALGGLISPTMLAVTAGAGAFALMAKAVVDGYTELRAYDRALISTGNTVGLTGAQMVDLADRVGAATGSFGDAETAAAALAGSGKLTGAALEDATRAAVNLARLTGDSIENTTDKIIKLAASPTKGMEELNSQYHFLTLAVYDQVRALEEQGRTQDAARVVLEAFADVHDERVRDMQAGAGTLERAWNGIKTALAGAWDGLQRIGQDNIEADLRAAEERLRLMQGQQANFGAYGPARVAAAQAEVDGLRAQVMVQQQSARLQAEAQARADKAIAERQAQRKAEQDWERLRLSNLDKQQRLEAEIADIRKTGATAGKSEADIEAQIAAARQRYADSLPKPTKAPKTDAQQAEEAAQRELDNLQKQVAMLGAVEDGQKRASEEARVRYDIENGGLAAASAATKALLIDEAKLLDAKRAEQTAEQDRQREFEKTEKAYERLRDALRTPAEAAVDKAIEQIKTLNAALKQGTGDAGSYNEQVGRIISAAFTTAPDFAGLAPEIGGIDSEQFRLDQAAEKLDTWYQDQLSRLAKFREEQSALNAQWNAQEQTIQAEHSTKLAELADAQNYLTLKRGEDAFAAMASMAQRAAGEQSAAYRALFALSKGFALAQAVMSLGISLAKAQEKGFPWSFAESASVLAQFANITSIISSAVLGYADGGPIRGPGTGTSDSVPIWASDGEFMVRAAAAQQPGAALFLDDFNRRGMAALAQWQGLATGGFVSAEPRAALSAGPPAQTVNRNNMRVYVLQNEDQLAARLAQHPTMEKAIVVTAGENGRAIQAQW